MMPATPRSRTAESVSPKHSDPKRNGTTSADCPVAQATPQTVPPGAVRAYVVSDKPGRRPDWLAAAASLPPRGDGQGLIDVIWHADRSTTRPGW